MYAIRSYYGRLARVVKQCLSLTGTNGILQPTIKCQRVIGRGCIEGVATEPAQVVGSAAAAHNQYALRAQRTQRPPDIEVVPRSEARLQRQLDHRHIGLRIHEAERHPGAVIETALAIDVGWKPGLAQQRRDLRGQLRITRGRVANLV